jgi:glycosyltransferase involved in cell wall biosynthesis
VSAAGGRGPRVVCACDFHLRYCTRLAAGLDREGAEVVLMTRDHDLEFGAEQGAASSFIAATVGAGVTHRALSGRVRSPGGWAQATRMRRALHRFDPEVVHLQESVGNDPRLLLAGVVGRRRLALTIHDPSPHPGDRVPRQDAFLNSALVRAAGLVFVHGEALKEQLVERLHPRAPVVVVPHGVAAAAVSPVPADPSLLFFGRISYYKGIDVLLDAMAAVWKGVPAARLTIAGEGDLEPHPALDDSRVTLRRGHIPDADVPGLIEASRCVVLPYREASQSGVGSLVKPYGRPLVVTAVGGLPELVADGSGLTAPSQDPAALAAALVEVLTDAPLAARLGAAGAATAGAGASWDSVARLTLDAYREHLGVG